jgi:hypothetical protein
MQIGSTKYVVNWRHLIFLAILFGAVLWYLLEVRSVSLAVNNLLLVQPLSLFVLFMCLLVVPQCFRRADAVDEDELLPDDPLAPLLPSEGKDLATIGVLGLSLGIAILVMDKELGRQRIQHRPPGEETPRGERRPLALLVYPLAVTLAVIYGFKAMMPYPLETILL